MKTIREHKEDAYRSIIRSSSGKGKEVLDFAREYFNEYVSGSILSVPREMEELLNYAVTSEDEKTSMRRYLFAENIIGAAERAGKIFADLYQERKYMPDYTLDNFLLTWSSENGKDSFSGDYRDLLSNLIEFLEFDNSLVGYVSSRDGRIYGGEPITTLGIKSILVDNADRVSDFFMTALDDPIKSRVSDIVYDRNLAQESGEEFLTKVIESRCDLQDFLMHYLPDSGVRMKNTGLFSPMFRRMARRSNYDWKGLYFSLLQEPVQSRVIMTDREVSEGVSILQEQEMRLLEALATEGSLKYLTAFIGDGSDAEDLFNALNVKHLTGQNAAVLREMLKKGRNHIRKHMGVLRVPAADLAVKYDWRMNLEEISTQIKPEDYNSNEVVSSILYNKAKQAWELEYRADPKGAIAKLMQEAQNSKNPVYKAVLKKVLSHYELRQRVGNVSGIVTKLKVKQRR